MSSSSVCWETSNCNSFLSSPLFRFQSFFISPFSWSNFLSKYLMMDDEISLSSSLFLFLLPFHELFSYPLLHYLSPLSTESELLLELLILVKSVGETRRLYITIYVIYKNGYCFRYPNSGGIFQAVYSNIEINIKILTSDYKFENGKYYKSIFNREISNFKYTFFL